ncbi:MAG: FAD:protein FMN transferase [Chitinophagaceae bacterium]
MLKTVKQLVIAVALLTVMSGAELLPGKSIKIYVSDYENVLGTSLEIKIAADDEQRAVKAEGAALAEIDRLNKILSGYDSSSEFSRWMKADKKPTMISTDLFEVLALFDKWRFKSNGAIDASAEVISKIWKDASMQNRLPSASEIAVALREVKRLHYKLDEKNHTVLRLTNDPLMLNSFTKSYVMNKASDAVMASAGVIGVVMNIGGDIQVRGAHMEQIYVSNPKANAENDPPVASIYLRNKTIATSGNYRRGELINGKWYSHIVDPRTGKPASGVISATVIADGATDAGALATALNILSLEEGRQLVASVPGAEFMLITADGKRLSSAGWKKLENPLPIKDLEPLSSSSKDKNVGS